MRVVHASTGNDTGKCAHSAAHPNTRLGNVERCVWLVIDRYDRFNVAYAKKYNAFSRADWKADVSMPLTNTVGSRSYNRRATATMLPLFLLSSETSSFGSFPPSPALLAPHPACICVLRTSSGYKMEAEIAPPRDADSTSEAIDSSSTAGMVVGGNICRDSQRAMMMGAEPETGGARKSDKPARRRGGPSLSLSLSTKFWKCRDD